MKTRYNISILLLVTMITMIMLSSCTHEKVLEIKSSAPTFIPVYEGEACIKDRCFVFELADESSEYSIGLMGREALAKDSGMLFEFYEYDIYKFWMKNTLIPLDIMWIANRTIVYISHDAKPCKRGICETIDPKTKANYVLEINGGLAKEYDIRVGDSVNITFNNI